MGAWRCGATVFVVATCFCAVFAVGAAATPKLLMEPDGIDGVHFGIAKTQAMSELTGLLGKPTARFMHSGCGPRYTEAAWEHLYVEFRLGVFTGYRYIEDGWPARRLGEKPVASRLPLLATSRGVTLGSTLGELRAAYRRLRLVGADRWRAPNGLIFYDDAQRDPPPTSSRIIEIKIGTCGDY